MNNSSLNNPYLIEKYQNGDSWYRIYSNGWCEQGGIATTNNVKFNFLIEFKDTDYNIQASSVTSATPPSSDCYLIFNLKDKDGAKLIGRPFPASWRACGYVS